MPARKKKTPIRSGGIEGPKRGSLKRLGKQLLNATLTNRALDQLGAFVIKVTRALVYTAYSSAQHMKRVTIKADDVVVAAQKHGIELKKLSNVSLSDVEKCTEADYASANTLKRHAAAVQDAINAGKGSISVQDRKNQIATAYSDMLRQTFRFDWSNLDCITFQKASFRKMVEEILAQEGIDTLTGRGKESKTVRWSEDALLLLQLIVERNTLVLASGAFSAATAARKQRVSKGFVEATENTLKNSKYSYRDGKPRQKVSSKKSKKKKSD